MFYYVLILANNQCFWTGKYDNITNCLVQWILTWNFNFDLNLIFKLNFWETKYYCSFDSNKVAISGKIFNFLEYFRMRIEHLFHSLIQKVILCLVKCKCFLFLVMIYFPREIVFTKTMIQNSFLHRKRDNWPFYFFL